MTSESLPPTTGATSPAPRCTSPPGVGICKLSAPSSKPVCLGSALFQRCVSSRVLAHSMALMRTTVCQTLTFIHSTQPILCAVAANLPPPPPAGANRDCATLSGATPLGTAACNGHLDVVAFLLRAGLLCTLPLRHKNVSGLLLGIFLSVFFSGQPQEDSSEETPEFA